MTAHLLLALTKDKESENVRAGRGLRDLIHSLHFTDKETEVTVITLLVLFKSHSLNS